MIDDRDPDAGLVPLDAAPPAELRPADEAPGLGRAVAEAYERAARFARRHLNSTQEQAPVL